ncbi:methionine ABC transporter substrate-binding protein [Escherichia coli]|uniref:Methionine ABC transporter substrate-binding protein n=1 Tax=Escherichia coli TaxID=562 RepID=A0A2X1NFQ3_ECOLX|nr:methionine ABC transporter substrate-binding protein [Escherichia coli]
MQKHIKVGVYKWRRQDVAEVAKKVAKEKYGLDVELVGFSVRCYRTMRQIMANLMRMSSSIDPFLNKIIRRMVINW